MEKLESIKQLRLRGCMVLLQAVRREVMKVDGLGTAHIQPLKSGLVLPIFDDATIEEFFVYDLGPQANGDRELARLEPGMKSTLLDHPETMRISAGEGEFVMVPRPAVALAFEVVEVAV